MIIYRVEKKNPKGEFVGMYTSGMEYISLWSACTDGANDGTWHPLPQYSSCLMDQCERKEHLKQFPEYSFGFTTKRQFFQWVYDPEWRHNMTKEDGYLNVYKVDKRHVCFDEHQAMFIKDKATLVESLPVNHFDRK